MHQTSTSRTAALALLLLLALDLSACGSSDRNQRLQVKAEYTTPQVIQTFEERYEIADRKNETEPVATVEDTGKRYASLAQALAEAPDGATVVLEAGVFRESILVSGKRLSIRGQGPDKTIILSAETAVYVSRGHLTLSNLGVWSLSVGADVAAVAVSESRAFVSDCRVSGATGPGLLVAGKSAKLTAVGNLISGNMAGGIRAQGGTLKLQRNVITRNARGGIVLAPAVPGAVTALSLWHDTVLDNWSGRRCVAFAKTGVVPVGSLDRYSIESTILNSGGIGETFSEEFYAVVKEQGSNFISPGALPAEGFFTAPESGDFRPRAAIIKDPMGLEIGAFPSAAGQSELVKTLSNALVSEKLQLAYILSLFLSPVEREQAQERIRQVLYNWVGDYLKYKRLGSRFFAALGLARVVPEHWRLDVILERFIEGFVSRYTFTLNRLNFFPDSPGLAERIAENLKGKTSFFPRFVVMDSDSPNSFVVSGRVIKPLVQDAKVKEFEVRTRIKNPYAAKVKKTLQMLESRKTETARKLADVDYTLNNPHLKAAKNSRRRVSLEKKRASLAEQLARLEGQLAPLIEQDKTVGESFDINVRGEVRETTVTGSVFASMVMAPAGDIMLDATTPVQFKYSLLEAYPLPEFGFEGKTISGEAADPETHAARRLADLMLHSLIAKETDHLRNLLLQFKEGSIDGPAEDTLVDLLLLNAPLYRRALESRTEYEELARRALSPEPEVAVEASYDPSRGSDIKGVVINVVYHDEAQARSRLDELEHVYKPYWELQEPISHFLKMRFGITEELFFETRDVLGELLGK